jgi:LysR family transcriptional regulator, benzoate and cis,cis-muconate-responsive activator of ben and cat genes
MNISSFFMNLKQFRYFCETVEAKSGKIAAQNLFIAPTAISMQISQDALGGTLLNRSSRPMELTALGKFFYPRIKEILSSLDKLTEESKEIAKGNQGWISIGFVRSTIFSILPNSIREFREQHPEIKIELIELLSDHQIESIRKGLIHVGLIRQIGKLEEEEDIKYVLILRDPLIAAIPKSHHLAKNKVLSSSIFNEIPFISYPNDPASSFSKIVINLLKENGVTPILGHNAQEIHTALGLVGSGLGATIVGESAIQNNREDVQFTPINNFNFYSDIYLISKNQEENMLIEYFKQIIYHQSRPKTFKAT